MNHIRKGVLLLSAAVSLFIISAFPMPVSAATWTQQTGLGTHPWALHGVAMSSDGLKILVGESLSSAGTGRLYTSVDGGTTWTARTSAGTRSWSAVASSDDGLKLLASETSTTGVPGYIYMSTDGGSTWTQNTSAGLRAWSALSISGDGSKFFAAAGGNIYTSNNGGATWTQHLSIAYSVRSIASSTDGVKVVAGTDGDYIYTSTDSGVTWTARTSSGKNTWLSVASSSDGLKLLASSTLTATTPDSGDGYLYTSNDGGVTWVKRTGAGLRSWHVVASSADGMNLAAAGQDRVSVSGFLNGPIYISNDGGVTWSATSSGNKLWWGLSSSSDGSRIVGLDSAQYLHTGILTVSPTVMTNAVSSITSTNAVFSGTITSTGGAPASVVGFRYGLTNSYGSTVTGSSTSYGVGDFSVSTTVALTCNTTYHYQAFATNSAGTAYGSDMTFTTGPCAGSVGNLCELDLVARTHTCTGITGIEVLSQEGVKGLVKIDLASYPAATTVRFDGIFGSGTPEGWNLNIGDAVANDGFGGGNSTESNTAEIQLLTNQSAGPSYGFYAYGKDDVLFRPSDTIDGHLLLRKIESFGNLAGKTVSFVVGDSKIGYDLSTANPVHTGELISPYLYALNGQSDYTTGTSNRVIYGAFNRVVSNWATSRVGTGLIKARITIIDPSAVTPPVVTTLTANSITATTATLNGNLSSTGGDPTVKVGFRHSKGNAAEISVLAASSAATGPFSTSLTGLTCGTTYSFKAWASHSIGGANGQNLTFKTLPCGGGTIPTLITGGVVSVLPTSVTVNGKLVTLGSSAVPTRGFEYGTTLAYGQKKFLTLKNSMYSPGASFNMALTGLTCGTLYHYRAYASSAVATGYGEDKTFTSGPCPTAPTVTTGSTTMIDRSNQIANGTYVLSGGLPVATRGIQYGLTTEYGSTKSTTLRSGVFTPGTSYSNTLTGLTCGTEYHYRAFATNSAGTGYGEDKKFTSGACPTAPIVTTGSTTMIDRSNQSASGTLVSTGGSSVSTRGIQYGLTTEYGSTKSMTLPGSSVFKPGTSYSNTLTGLTCGTLYHYRAFASNASVTGYGEDKTFISGACPNGTTPPSSTTQIPATVVTVSSGLVNSTGATLNGSLTSLGSATAVSVGFDYGSTTSYGSTVTLGDSLTSSAGFSFRLSLSCGTTYHFRAFAESMAGKVYGNDMTLTTGSCLNSLGANVLGALSMKNSSGQVIESEEPAAPAVNGYTFSRTLRPATTGEDVTKLQDYLAERGYLQASTRGYYGPLTVRAVKEFQAANGLESVGNVGPLTLKLLNSLSTQVE